MVEDAMNKRYVTWLGLLVVGAAIVNEQRKPPAQRGWHDRLLGLVPYAFRPPTWARVHKTLWDGQRDQVFVPQVFGVGWSINVGGRFRRLGWLIRA